MNKVKLILDKNRRFIILCIIVFIAFFIFTHPLQNTEHSRELYKIAREYQEEGKYSEAYSVYSRIPPGYPAYDVVLYQASVCATQIGKEKNVVATLKYILSHYWSSKLTPKAAYNLGQSYMRTKNYNKAEKQFTKVIKKFARTDYAVGSLYYLGQLSKEKNSSKSLDYWLKYVESAPDGKFAAECISEIESENFSLDEKQRGIVGKALAMQKNYVKALTYLEKSNSSIYWYYLAKAYAGSGMPDKALKVLEKGLSSYKESNENIHNAMVMYTELSPQSDKDDWYKLAEIALSNGDFALYKLSIIEPSYKTSQINRLIVANYPAGQFASEALWQIFWEKYKIGQYTDALNLGEEHVKKYFNRKASPKILYWIGKIYDKKGDSFKSQKYFRDVIKLYPDSYYAFRSNAHVKELFKNDQGDWNEELSSAIPDVQPEKVFSYDEVKRDYGNNVAEMIEAGDYDMAQEIAGKDKFLESWIEYKKGMLARSASIARDAMKDIIPKPSVLDPRWMLIYPIHYADYINSFSSENGVNRFIILSLIKEESHFNPLISSSSDARGLMQILPTTSVDIARWEHLPTIAPLMLFQPKTNILYGTAYFKYLKANLDNNSLLAVAAYNAGPGAVRKWVNNMTSDDMDEFVENIPYDQTQTYVKKVFGSYWNYKRIYLK